MDSDDDSELFVTQMQPDSLTQGVSQRQCDPEFILKDIEGGPFAQQQETQAFNTEAEQDSHKTKQGPTNNADSQTYQLQDCPMSFDVYDFLSPSLENNEQQSKTYQNMLEAQYAPALPKIKIEPGLETYPRKSKPRPHLDLCGDEAIESTWVPFDQRPRFDPSTIQNRIIELSDADDELPDPPAEKGSSRDGVVVKKDPDLVPYEWVDMDEDTLSISSGDEDDVKLIWADNDKTCIDLSKEESTVGCLKLGKTALAKRLVTLKASKNPADRRKILLAQQLLAKRVRQDHRRNVGLGRSLQQSSDFARATPSMLIDDNGDDNNDNSWMSKSCNFDQEEGKRFKEIQKAYQRKVKFGQNTEQDDVKFICAESRENSRLKRLEHEYEVCKGYDAEPSEESNLLTTSPSPAPGSKRRSTSNDQLDNDPDHEAKNPAKRTRVRKTPRKQGRLVNQEEELEMSMRAGLEEYLKKQQRKDRKAQNEAGTQITKEKGKRKGKVRGKGTSVVIREKPKRRSRNQAGYINDIGSLLTSNVFDDAANNIADANMPQAPMNVTDKHKFMASLVAGLSNSDPRRQEKNHILRCTSILGIKRVSQSENKEETWVIKGMKSRLRHHQVQGTAFMKERELADEGPWGGIVADAMGLGKTVEAIALIVCNPPKPSEKFKSTLIVVQPGLLAQCLEELKKHVEEDTFTRIMVIAAGSRALGKGEVRDLEKADVVVTTYTEVVRSYPKAEMPKDINSEADVIQWWQEHWLKERGSLHKANFYRVILDESQGIKNYKTQTSIACRGLMAKHRWALSATPIMNSKSYRRFLTTIYADDVAGLDELYPYFKFLHVQGTGTFEEFEDMYCVTNDVDCKKRLVCLLNNIMVRRTMKDKVLGKPIVELPPCKQRVELLYFDMVERCIYDIVSRRFVRAINRASQAGGLGKKPIVGLLMFLRLRQLAAHPFLIQETLQEIFDEESVDRLEEKVVQGRNDREYAKTVIAALRRLVKAKGDATEESPDAEDEHTPPPPGELAVKLGKKIRKLKADGKVEEVRAEKTCHRCKDRAVDPQVTSCLHVYCKECLDSMAGDACEEDLDSTPCDECRTVFTKSEPCSNVKELQIEESNNLTPSIGSKKTKPRKKVVMKWVDYDNKLVLSAKTIAVEKQLRSWIAEDPQKKIIVFSQFLMM